MDVGKDLKSLKPPTPRPSFIEPLGPQHQLRKRRLQRQNYQRERKIDLEQVQNVMSALQKRKLDALADFVIDVLALDVISFEDLESVFDLIPKLSAARLYVITLYNVLNTNTKSLGHNVFKLCQSHDFNINAPTALYFLQNHPDLISDVESFEKDIVDIRGTDIHKRLTQVLYANLKRLDTLERCKTLFQHWEMVAFHLPQFGIGMDEALHLVHTLGARFVSLLLRTIESGTVLKKALSSESVLQRLSINLEYVDDMIANGALKQTHRDLLWVMMLTLDTEKLFAAFKIRPTLKFALEMEELYVASSEFAKLELDLVSFEELSSHKLDEVEFLEQLNVGILWEMILLRQLLGSHFSVHSLYAVYHFSHYETVYRALAPLSLKARQTIVSDAFGNVDLTTLTRPEIDDAVRILEDSSKRLLEEQK